MSLSRGLFALVDDEDFDLVLAHEWRAIKGHGTFYAHTWIDGESIGMHRLLTDPLATEVVDHQNGDGLDNRRCNLRPCLQVQNMQNRRKQTTPATSRFKGVHFDKGKWRSGIVHDGERVDLGRYNSEILAARQYDRAARLLFGRFARTNESLGLFVDVVDRTIPVTGMN
ncbi:putative Pathogenesis-related transcriptional factor and ERF protein [Bradyrhizobium sp. STM 3843]|nr:putative Pathogenesis-related transcriptional factor and ERF protein [Bradyrhizobium sp. STM 3843]